MPNKRGSSDRGAKLVASRSNGSVIMARSTDRKSSSSDPGAVVSAAGMQAQHPAFSERDALLAMPGRQLILDIEQVDRISRIQRRNVQDFLSHTSSLGADLTFPLQILDSVNREVHRLFEEEVERLLHNVVASVMSRIDLQRKLVRRVWSSDPTFLAGPLRQQTELFRQDGACRFLQNLRNYMLHNALPARFANYQFYGDGRLVYSVLLSAESLLNTWNRWDPVARSWLESKMQHDDNRRDINIGEIVSYYAEKSEVFDRWLVEQMTVGRQGELIAYRAAEKGYQERWGTGRSAHSD